MKSMMMRRKKNQSPMCSNISVETDLLSQRLNHAIAIRALSKRDWQLPSRCGIKEERGGELGAYILLQLGRAWQIWMFSILGFMLGGLSDDGGGDGDEN
jgi:hypothetical protein